MRPAAQRVQSGLRPGHAVGLPRLLTVAEAADFLRTTKKAVYAKVARGQLPCVRDGRACSSPRHHW